jgi:hypothetical protein
VGNFSRMGFVISYVYEQKYFSKAAVMTTKTSVFIRLFYFYYRDKKEEFMSVVVRLDAS